MSDAPMIVQWPDNIEVDQMHPSALVGMNIPTEAWVALTTIGVPRNLRLPDWPGPTLFTSALGDGRLPPFRPEMANPDMTSLVSTEVIALGGAYLLGSSLMPAIAPDYALRAFCLRKESGEVIEVDLTATAYVRDRGRCIRFTNSNLPHFLSCLLFFYESWPIGLTLDEDDIAAQRRFALSYLRRGLKHRDPRTFEDRDDYWTMPIADICMDL